jgi:hypothetical protein
MRFIERTAVRFNIYLKFIINDFLIEHFPEPSALGFYWIKIIPVLRPILAVLSLYHEWQTGLISAMMAKLITNAQLKRA